MARGTVNDATELRGYTLTYPNSLKPQFDVISIAIANAFEPFPAPAGALRAIRPSCRRRRRAARC